MTQGDMPLELAGIDVNGALKRLKVKMEIYRKSLLAFVKNYGDMIAGIQSALDKQDIEEARELLHTLRGAALNIGADEVETSAGKVRKAIISGNTDVRSLIANLETELNIVLGAIRSIEQNEK